MYARRVSSWHFGLVSLSGDNVLISLPQKQSDPFEAVAHNVRQEQEGLLSRFGLLVLHVRQQSLQASFGLDLLSGDNGQPHLMIIHGRR